MFLHVSVILFMGGGGGGVVSQHALQVVSQYALQQVSWGGGCYPNMHCRWYPSMPCSRSPGGWYPSMPCRWYTRSTPGGSPGPHQGVCIPACTEADTPSRGRLLPRLVRILLECILAFNEFILLFSMEGSIANTANFA